MFGQIAIKIAPGSMVDLFKWTDTENKRNGKGLSPEIGMTFVKTIAVDIIRYHLTCMQSS